MMYEDNEIVFVCRKNFFIALYLLFATVFSLVIIYSLIYNILNGENFLAYSIALLVIMLGFNFLIYGILSIFTWKVSFNRNNVFVRDFMLTKYLIIKYVNFRLYPNKVSVSIYKEKDDMFSVKIMANMINGNDWELFDLKKCNKNDEKEINDFLIYINTLVASFNEDTTSDNP